MHIGRPGSFPQAVKDVSNCSSSYTGITSKKALTRANLACILQYLSLLHDRAAHGWAVKAMAQEATLAVEILASSAAPGQNVVQLQVRGELR